MAPAKRKPTPQERRQDLLLTIRDLAVAAVAVAVIIGAIWAYAGVWPPMVVVESGSMMHQDDASALGIIDTGDLTLVKAVRNDAEIKTYMQGDDPGVNYRTYGNFGDVVIYAKNCDFTQTPIIHRAITRVEVNASGDSFDFPELDPPVWGARRWNGGSVPGDIVAFDIWTYDTNGPVGREIQIRINITTFQANMAPPYHGGLLTKGDNNGNLDQLSLPFANGHGFVEPVEDRCILGVARGELPWFGIIKLWVSKTGNPAPPNSVSSLIIVLIAIVTVPFVLEVAWDRYGDRVKGKIPLHWRERWHRFFDRWPGGKRRALERAESKKQREAAEARRERRERGRRSHRQGDEGGLEGSDDDYDDEGVAGPRR